MNNPLRSLAGRITLLVFLATLISSLMVSWISLQSLDGFLRKKIDQRFPLVAHRVVNELDQWYELRERELEVFADSTILAESVTRLLGGDAAAERVREEAEQYLRYVLDGFPHLERLVLVSLEGERLLEVGPGDALPARLLARKQARTSQTWIGEARPLADRMVQIASVPITDGTGRVAARLFATIEVSSLETILQSDELGASARLYLVDRQGRFLNPPEGIDPERLYEGDGARTDVTSPVAYYDGPFGQRVVGTQIAFPRFRWTLVIEQPYDDAFAPIVRSMSRVILLNVAIVLFVGLAAYRIAGSIVKPLHALSDAAKRLSRGEREVEIDEKRRSSEEVDVLTRTFNEMSRGLGRNARELEENQRQIEAANQELVAKNEELSNMNLVLEQLSITDGLTKLHNHRFFQEALEAECRRSSRTGDPLCLVLIDIDYFKKWNDRLGHAGGDEILRRIAEILHQSVRETDLLARYGGEEFALLAIDTTLPGATALGEKIRQAVEATSFVTDVPSEREPLTVSVGVAAYAGDRTQLFVDADEALYAAKDAGRNRVVVARPSTDGASQKDSAIGPAGDPHDSHDPEA